MNHRPNDLSDQELDSYLQGGSEYSRRYVGLSVDDVPADLDTAVLHHAKQQAEQNVRAATSHSSQPRRRTPAFWMRFAAPVALAASLVIVVSIVRQPDALRESVPSASRVDAVPAKEQAAERSVPVAAPVAAGKLVAEPKPNESFVPEPNEADRQSSGSVSTATLKRSEVSRAPQPSKAETDAPTLADGLAKSAASREVAPPEPSVEERVAVAAQKPAAAPMPTVPAPTPEASPNVAPETKKEAPGTRTLYDNSSAEQKGVGLEEVVVTGRLRKSTQTGAGPHGTVQGTGAIHEPTETELEQQARETDPESWLRYIRELRADQQTRKANREWRRFVKAYPEYSVDDTDTARPAK